ncbi:glycine oxidase ThiO [Halomonas denitrificans]|uniref:glycine oxidase ThiO n=1 Tax=Halomonas denitrificans TaxID=370769 RepID=UPI001CD43609|nr:glycine oxidase ThiO [Halomonas denitrificans]MCA0976461.1 glycine oxidase ThiO [Halomonas denitrificans]
MSEFVVIGGGVIGLMTALQLADAGHSITVIDRGQCGREASWAGGGIVSPLYPWRYSDPVSQLASWSEGAYPELSLSLLEETGVDPEYRQKGLLYLRVEDETRALAWARGVGKPLSRVGAEVIRAKEPQVRQDVEDALWMPTLGSIRNPRLMRSLKTRLSGMPGVTFAEQTSVTGLNRQGQRVTSVATDQGDVGADQVVICAGAWSAQLAKLADLSLPVRPVKGQMLLFKAPPGMVERVVLMDGRYVIPRGDGRVLAGSTLEEAGFDKGVDEQARQSLWQSATGIIPALASCEVEHQWAGLRPGSPDGVPFIGRAPGWDNLHVNAGHYRNGLVLAPASTRLLVDQMLGRRPIIEPSAYALEGRLEQ